MKTPLKRLKYFLGLGFTGLIIFSSLVAVIPTPQVSAQGDAAPAPAPAPNQNQNQNQNAAWVDANTITYAGMTFKGPQGPTGPDGFYRYYIAGSTGCATDQRSFIEFRNNPTAQGNNASEGFLDLWAKLGGECTKSDTNRRLSIRNPQNAKLSMAQARCQTQQSGPDRDRCIQNAAISICGTGASEAVQTCIARQTNLPTAGAASDVTEIQTGAPEDPDLDCDVNWNPLTWVICPFVKMINNTINGLDNAITGLLTVEQEKIFNTNAQPGKGYYAAWQTFRSIALGLLVAGALIMIISQALGFDFLDAYTVKKVVPRLIVAIIGISLSWEIMRWFVVFTNDLGLGIRSLIYYPFTQAGLGDLGDTALAGGAAIPLLVAGGFLGLGLMGLLSFGATALLALLLAFFVLILRQLIIVVLILAAPIAIAAYILPNTQSIWKLWYESFTKALMMFPIIMAFIAVGRVFAMTSGGEGATVVGQFIAFIAYILPYFLIPLSFRFAGGALRTLGGFVNDRGRGAFDRLKKYRGNKFSHNWQAMQQNRRFNPNANGRLGKFNRKLNSGLSNMTSPGEAAKIAVGNRLRKRGVDTSIGMGVMNQVNQGRFEHSKKASEMLMNMPLNDRALRGLQGLDDTSAESIRHLGNQLVSSNDLNDRIAGNMLLSSATQLSTDLYKNPEMGRADIRAAAGMALAQHGFAEPEDIAQLGNRLGANTYGGAVKDGFAQAVVNQAQLNSMRAGRSDFKPGYSVRLGTNGTFEGMSLQTEPDARFKGKRLDKADPEAFQRALGAQIERVKGMGAQDWTAGKAQAIDSVYEGAKTILSTPSGTTITYRDEANNERTIEITESMKERLLTQYASALGPYSGASIDHTSKIEKIIADAGLTETMKKRLEAYRQGEASKAAADAAQNQPAAPRPPDQPT